MHIDGHAPLQILSDLIMPRTVVEAGQYVHLTGSALMCPKSLAHLLDDRVKLAHEAVLAMETPVSGLAFILDHRHCSDVSTAMYASISELVAPSVGPALRCLRGDLQRFVATVAWALAAAGGAPAPAPGPSTRRMRVKKRNPSRFASLDLRSAQRFSNVGPLFF